MFQIDAKFRNLAIVIYIYNRFGESLVIREGRHPILDHMGTVVVANDVTATPESNFSVITGANMSGKSTYLKQVQHFSRAPFINMTSL